MGRTACTEPQCLYKGDLYLYLYAPHNFIWAEVYTVYRPVLKDKLTL